MSEGQLLIQGLINRDRQALRKLMESYQRFAYTVLSSMLHPHEAAEAGQVTFINVLQEYQTIQGKFQSSKMSDEQFAEGYKNALEIHGTSVCDTPRKAQINLIEQALLRLA